MSLQIPSRLLEISIISAQDLPPVSKLLRTFAVAWLESDQRLTTRVDHKGHTNPTWNYKLVFPVDEKLLNLETYTLTFQIYNVAWLRDIPIGAACVPVKNLLLKSGPRPVTLYLSRPTGLLQGILNIGVNLIDSTAPSYSELSIATAKISDKSEGSGSPEQQILITKSGVSSANQTPSVKLQRQFTASTIMMHPLPSEVAAGFQRGAYSNDYGSSIFDNWTVAAGSERADKSNDGKMREIPLIIKDDYRPVKRKSKSDGGGLLSCFGNAYGFEFSIICGKKNRKKMLRKTYTNPQEKLRSFHV